MTRQCSQCEKNATHGPKDSIPVRCLGHKETGDRNTQFNICRSDQCRGFVTCKQYMGFCRDCLWTRYPERATAHREKELTIVEHIQEWTSELCPLECPPCSIILETRFNKRVPLYNQEASQIGECLYRPDILITTSDKHIMVEIDENEHLQYDARKESNRLATIKDRLGDKPLIVFRFNPDSYQRGAAKQESAFYKDPRTGNVIPNHEELQYRLEVLKTRIEDSMKIAIKVELVEERLFYSS